MFAACVIVSCSTAVVLATSAVMKVRHHPICLETFATCRLPLEWLPRLAALEAAAAVGMVLGLGWAPLGIAAGAGAVGYFVVAVAAHVRVGDWKGLASPVFPLALSLATLVLHIATA